MRARIVAAVVTLAIAGASILGASQAEAKTVRWWCHGNGYALIVDNTWANYLSNHGWWCQRIYAV